MSARPWLLLVVTWIAFVAFGLAMKALTAPAADTAPWIAQAVLKLGLLVVVLAAAAATMPLRDVIGARIPGSGARRSSIAALALGAAASLVALLTGSTGMSSLIGRFTFPQIVLWIWIVSSVSEEVLCRGWFQGLLSRWAAGADAAARHAQVVLPSAILFGSMHLTLLWAGAGLRSTVVIVAFTTALGYICALARERTGSLWPAVAAHVLFNVGGVAGGILYNVGYRILMGRFPTIG